MVSPVDGLIPPWVDDYVNALYVDGWYGDGWYDDEEDDCECYYYFWWDVNVDEGDEVEGYGDWDGWEWEWATDDEARSEREWLYSCDCEGNQAVDDDDDNGGWESDSIWTGTSSEDRLPSPWTPPTSQPSSDEDVWQWEWVGSNSDGLLQSPRLSTTEESDQRDWKWSDGDTDGDEDDDWTWYYTDAESPVLPSNNDLNNEDWQYDDEGLGNPAPSERPTPMSSNTVTPTTELFTLPFTYPTTNSHETPKDNSTTDFEEHAPNEWLPPFDQASPPPSLIPHRHHHSQQQNWFHKLFKLWDPTSDPLASDQESPNLSSDADTDTDGDWNAGETALP